VISPLGGGQAALWMGGQVVGPVFGSDPAATQSWLLRQMTGPGGGCDGLFASGLGSLHLGAPGLGASLYRGPMMMNPYAMNPAVMGSLPYSPLALSAKVWL
jgi:hypothetical protein